MPQIAHTPIGTVRSSFEAPDGMPWQSVAAAGVLGSIEVDPYRFGDDAQSALES